MFMTIPGMWISTYIGFLPPAGKDNVQNRLEWPFQLLNCEPLSPRTVCYPLCLLLGRQQIGNCGNLSIWVRPPLKYRCPMRSKCIRNFPCYGDLRASPVPGWLSGVKGTGNLGGKGLAPLYFPTKGREKEE